MNLLVQRYLRRLAGPGRADEDDKKEFGQIDVLVYGLYLHMIGESKNWRFAYLDSTPIYEGRTLAKSVENVRNSLFHRGCFVKLYCKESRWIYMHGGHSIIWSIKGSQAVDPRIHVSSIELRKSEYFRAYIMESIPINNLIRIDSYDQLYPPVFAASSELFIERHPQN